MGRMVAVKDALGNVTRAEYDVLSRLKKSTDALAGVVEFGFDGNGNLTSHKDQDANVTTYAFNNLSLVSSKTDALTHAESYLYRANGMRRSPPYLHLSFGDAMELSEVTEPIASRAR